MKNHKELLILARFVEAIDRLAGVEVVEASWCRTTGISISFRERADLDKFCKEFGFTGDAGPKMVNGCAFALKEIFGMRCLATSLLS